MLKYNLHIETNLPDQIGGMALFGGQDISINYKSVFFSDFEDEEKVKEQVLEKLSANASIDKDALLISIEVDGWKKNPIILNLPATSIELLEEQDLVTFEEKIRENITISLEKSEE